MHTCKSTNVAELDADEGRLHLCCAVYCRNVKLLSDLVWGNMGDLSTIVVLQLQLALLHARSANLSVANMGSRRFASNLPVANMGSMRFASSQVEVKALLKLATGKTGFSELLHQPGLLLHIRMVLTDFFIPPSFPRAEMYKTACGGSSHSQPKSLFQAIGMCSEYSSSTDLGVLPFSCEYSCFLSIA